jgi:hypothetical protein
MMMIQRYLREVVPTTENGAYFEEPGDGFHASSKNCHVR